MNVAAECPYCGEPLELSVDEHGGRRQSYVEDCVVCCRPIEVNVVVDAGDVDVRLRSQDD
ncbi:MAG TPA: CPXCG motif-containing cysteine-rich protein [Vicinamibacteria bacterium]|nr:CPXCG motif-containing cysteine-rich protein [Vicinamibacteria bacterium]